MCLESRTSSNPASYRLLRQFGGVNIAWLNVSRDFELLQNTGQKGIRLNSFSYLMYLAHLSLCCAAIVLMHAVV